MFIKLLIVTILSIHAAFWGAAAFAAPEVHIIGIYEPRVKRGDTFVAPEVKVFVDRPGAEVRLVLSSHVPTRWLITLSDNTKLTGVVVNDREAPRSEVLLNGETYKKIDFRALPMAYKMQGKAFRDLVGFAPRLLGAPRLSSFQGAYTAPEDGFVVSTSQDDNPALDADYLKAFLADPATVPEKLRPYLNLDSQPKLSDSINLSEKGFRVVDDGGQPKIYPITLDVPQVSWVMGTARDPETGKLYGVTLGGEGLLYSFDPTKNKWAIETSMNDNDASGMIYDPVGKRLVIVISGMVAREGPALFFYGVNQRKTKTPLPMAAFPGLMDIGDPGNGPSPALIPVAVDGTTLLVQTALEPGMPRRQSGSLANPIRLYTVDMDSGDVQLVAYRDVVGTGADEW